MIRRLSVILILLLPALAAAQIAPQSQSRYIEAYLDLYNENTGEGGSDSGYDEAPFFNAFSSGVNPMWFEEDAMGDVYADQTSSIQPYQLSVSGGVGGYIESNGPDWFVDAYMVCYYEVAFRLDAPHTFALTGSFQINAPGGLYISLRDDMGTDYIDIFESWNDGDLSGTGTLPAGDYTFVVDGSADFSIFGFGADGGDTTFDADLDLTPDSTAVGDPRALARYLVAEPNPVTHATNVSFALGRGAPVTVEVLDARGRRIRTLDSAAPSVGSVLWDGRTDTGQRAPSGLYFLQARTGREVVRSKVSLVR